MPKHHYQWPRHDSGRRAAPRARRLGLTTAALIAGLVGSGCAFEDGAGFATLDATLVSRFAGLEDDAGRVQEDGWYKTNDSFELKLETLQLGYRNIALRGGSSGTAPSGDACRFDPANPPPGCSLCHNGHCHCGDAVKSYAELEAELCGVSSAPSGDAEVAQFPVAGVQILLGSGTETVLSDCRATGDPRLADQAGQHCELPAGSLEVAQLLLERLQVQARLRDRSAADRLGGEELTVAVDWNLAGAPFATPIDPPEPVDHESPQRITLALTLHVSAKLFDDVPWEALERDGKTITIDARHNTNAGEQITSNLALSEPDVTATRRDD